MRTARRFERVSSVPLPSLRAPFDRRHADPAPLDGADVSFWYNARAAIYQAASRLALDPGDRILVPAYTCGAEVSALLRAGLEPDYYRHHPDLTPDLDHLDLLCRKPARALYVTHYFGFPQPMDALLAFARDRNLISIEDCAHALYSIDELGRQLGTRADAGVFSLVKSLPLPDGGALVVNRPARPAASPPRRPELLAVAGPSRHLLEQRLALRHPVIAETLKRRVADPLVAQLKARRRGTVAPARDSDARAVSEAASHAELHPGRVDWGISRLALHLFRRSPHADIAERRRRNFSVLAEGIGDAGRVSPLLGALPAGCCPWLFPLVVEDIASLERHLADRGVGSIRTWSLFHDAVPMQEFAFESRLKRSVLSLPVHQDLGEPDMLRIAEAVSQWSG